MEEAIAYHQAAAMVKPRCLPVLPCPTCGVLDTVVLGPGVGPHVAALRCQAGHHIKWAPKVLLQPQEGCPVGGVNRVVLLGVIGRYGITMKYANNGTPCASFTLIISEQGQDGKAHSTFVDCEVWGKKAEAASEIEAGALVLYEGKLRKRQKGEGQWELIVSGFDVTPVLIPTPSLTGSSN